MNTTARMNHIIQPDGKTFILAMDHAANFNTLPALTNPKKLVKEIAAAGADAFLATVGMTEFLADSFQGKGIITRIDGGVSYLGDKSKPMTITVSGSDLARMGADAAITMSFPGSKFENDVLSNLTNVCMDCHNWGIPVLAEALPYGFEPHEDNRSAANLTFACRQSVELGADFVKTNYTGDQESFKYLCEATYKPVVILGGAKKVPVEQLLQEIKDALEVGGAGVAMGRNIWGHEDPVAYTAAIAKLIHENCSVEAAMKEMNFKVAL